MGLYSITTRASGTVLTATIFNDDHQNHVTHTEPMSINSYEPNVTTMGLTVDPLPSGNGTAVSLPLSTADELKRIRFVLQQLKARISANTSSGAWYIPASAVSDFVAFPVVACRRSQVTAQTISNGVSTQVLYDTTDYDTLGLIATGAGLLIPTNGVYAVGTSGGFGNGVTLGPEGDVTLSISRSSASVVTPLATGEVYSGNATGPKVVTVEALAHFTKGDYVQAYVFWSKGGIGGTEVMQSDANARPAIWMAQVSA